MRLFIISDLSDIHTKKWVSSLALRNIDVFLFGLNKPDMGYYMNYKNVTVYSMDVFSGLHNPMRNGGWEKWKYLKTLKILKQKIREFQPDILHAHYATSHGLLGALSGFHPFIISVWGSDVYDFPKISFIHKCILKYNLSRTDRILSTSYIMATETQKYTSEHIDITPFGVDTDLFKKNGDAKNTDGRFVLGTIKALNHKYGIDTLLEAFAIVKKRNPNKELILKIAGKGEELYNLKKKAEELHIEPYVCFLGEIENTKVPDCINQMDVFVALSRIESFGVAVVEAMACECPVVASDADGFKEVIADGETGFIVPSNDPLAAAEKIQKFIDDKGLGMRMGRMGRERVCALYNWKNNVDKMVRIYQDLLNINS